MPSTVAMWERTRSSSDGVLLGFGQPVEAVRQSRFRLRGGQRIVDPAPSRRVEQIGEHRRHRDRMGAQRGQIDAGRRHERFVDDQCGVEQFHRLVGGQRQDAVAAQPGADRRRPGRRSWRWPDPTAPTPARSPAAGARADARPARPGTSWPPRSWPGPTSPPARPSTKTSRTPTHSDRGSARADSTPRPPWPATPHRSARGSATSRPRRRAPRRRESPPRADAAFRISAITLASAARSAASQATTCTWAPAAASSADQLRRTRAHPGRGGSAAPGAATPCRATTCRASAEPAMPVPPVISTVPAAHVSGMRHDDLADVARLAQIPQRRFARVACRTSSPATAAARRRRTVPRARSIHWCIRGRPGSKRSKAR